MTSTHKNKTIYVIVRSSKIEIMDESVSII